MKIVALLLSILLVLKFFFLGFSFPYSFLSGEFEVAKLGRMGSEKICVIKSDDEGFLNLKSLLVKHSNEWYIDINNYAPTISFHGNNINIVINRGSLVVNYKHDLFGWIQLKNDAEVTYSESDFCN